MVQFLWICLGGAVATGARYLLNAGVVRALGAGFPWGILAVNLVGSFAMGSTAWVLQHSPAALSPTAQQALTVGILGGFTTYSSFNQETLRLATSGQWAAALLNVVFTLVGCAAAGLGGWAGAARLLGE